MERRALTSVEQKYLAAIESLDRSRGRYGIGDVAAEVRRTFKRKDAVATDRTSASKVVHRLVGFELITIGEYRRGCVRPISLVKPQRKSTAARKTASMR